MDRHLGINCQLQWQHLCTVSFDITFFPILRHFQHLSPFLSYLFFLRSVELRMNSFHFHGKSAKTARRRSSVYLPIPDMYKYHCATHPHEGGRSRCSPLVPRRKAAVVAHLVCSIHEVHWDAEGEWVVVGISQQDGHDLHPGGLGFPLSSLHGAIYWSLAVDGILAYLTPRQRGGENHKHAPSAMSSSISHAMPACSSLRILLKQRYISMQTHYSSQQTNSSSEKLQHRPQLQGPVKLRQTTQSLGNKYSLLLGGLDAYPLLYPVMITVSIKIEINSPSNLLSWQWNLVTIMSSPGKYWAV